MKHPAHPVRFIILAMTFLSLISITPVFAADGDLKIGGTKGDVTVISAAGGAQPASEGQLLQQGDAIKTGANSVAVLEFEGYGNYTVAAESDLMINKNEIAGSIINSELQMRLGTLKADLDHLPSGSSVQVRTPTAVAAVRGTSFMMMVALSGLTTTYVANGSLSLESLASGESTTVESGEAVASSDSGSEAIDPGSAEFAAIADSFEEVSEQGEDVGEAEFQGEGTASEDVPPTPEPEVNVDDVATTSDAASQ